MSLPLPVAALHRRARNAKSPKEQHDTAYFAWEAAIRLAVARMPPSDAAALAMPSLGHFVSAVEWSEALLSDAPLLELYGVLTETTTGQARAPKAVTPKQLLLALPPYRNQVIGHGSTRTPEFYERAGRALLDGLAAAFERHVFLPEASRLVFVQSVEVGSGGQRRARVLSLAGPVVALDGDGATPVPDTVLPARLYAREGDRYLPLHPWLLYRESELREAVLYFNGRGKSSAQYLDYESGEALKGKALAEAYPELDEELRRLFSAPVEAPAPSEPTPDANLFGDYRLLGKLGEGGMGIVYLARQESLGRVVALKVLPASADEDATAVARFQREIKALARCDHPNVVRILASGRAAGRHYYAMEFIQGADLAQLGRELSRTDDVDGAISSASDRVTGERAELFKNVPTLARRPMPQVLGADGSDRHRKLASMFRDAARALEYLHGQGILHRDVKPANLMVTAADHRVVIMDLGLAALSDATKSITRDSSSLLGTLRYMPPEQLQRSLLELDGRADVYALGATFWELFAGRKIFDGETEPRLIQQVLHEMPEPLWRVNPKIPKDLSAIVERALQKNRTQRFADAGALAAALEAFLAGRKVSLPGRGPSRAVLFGGGAVLAAALAVAGIVAASHGSAPAPHPDPAPLPGPGTKPGGGEAQAPTSTPGKLRFLMPSGVEGRVFVDGRLLGVTSEAFELASGHELHVRIEAEGYKPDERVVKLESGQLDVETVKLARTGGGSGSAAGHKTNVSNNEPEKKKDLTRELIHEPPRP